MYGLILENLAEYIRQVYGEDRWEEIRRQACVDQPSFSVHQVYPENLIPRLAKKAIQVVLLRNVAQTSVVKWEYICTSGARCDGKRVLRSDGCAFCSIRRSVRLRSRALGTRTSREGFSQRAGQSPRVFEVLLSANASAVVHLREWDPARWVLKSIRIPVRKALSSHLVRRPREEQSWVLFEFDFLFRYLVAISR